MTDTQQKTGDRTRVACDDNCGALENPTTLNEYKETLEHYKYHSYASGCSHGQ